jgi:hypothetical protein
MTGVTYGSLTELRRIGDNKKHPKYEYLCVCGKKTIKRIDHVKAGLTTSCGCVQRTGARKRMTSHGMSGTTEYATWKGIISRCTNPNVKEYARYGGRGITVSEEWLNSFETFYEDMGKKQDRYTIDRIDNNKGYSKDNCRWSTYSENNRNKQKSILIFYNGQTKPLIEWAEELGFNYGTLVSRLRRNKWPIKRLLEEQPFIGKNQSYARAILRELQEIQ